MSELFKLNNLWKYIVAALGNVLIEMLYGLIAAPVLTKLDESQSPWFDTAMKAAPFLLIPFALIVYALWLFFQHWIINKYDPITFSEYLKKKFTWPYLSLAIFGIISFFAMKFPAYRIFFIYPSLFLPLAFIFWELKPFFNRVSFEGTWGNVARYILAALGSTLVFFAYLFGFGYYMNTPIENETWTSPFFTYGNVGKINPLIFIPFALGLYGLWLGLQYFIIHLYTKPLTFLDFLNNKFTNVYLFISSLGLVNLFIFVFMGIEGHAFAFIFFPPLAIISITLIVLEFYEFIKYLGKPKATQP